MERRFLIFVCASAVFMSALLLIDRDGLPQQLAPALCTAAFLWLFVRSSIFRRHAGWGLYSYTHAINTGDSSVARDVSAQNDTRPMVMESRGEV